jgi:tRNA(fMet)-specific endonuclease VapC
MLDTNMVSYIVKGRSPSARARLLALKEDEVAAVSAITEAEIRYGLAKRPEATALKTLMDGFLASIKVLSWGRDEADTYGRVRAKLEKNGMSLGSMDMMIVAHAIATGAVLVTNDKAFAQVEDLSATVNWTTDL